MNSRLGIVCLLVCALTSFVVASAGCSKYGSATPPTPSPSPSGSPAPDTLYVQSPVNGGIVRHYKGMSKASQLIFATATLKDNNNSRPDVVYDPVSDTLWYPEANSASTHILMWTMASTKNGTNPDVVIPFPNGEGTAAFDPIHHLLFVAADTGPQVSVFANPETMTSSATPKAVITMNITDPNVPGGGPARPQEMLYDQGTDRLFVSDNGTVVAVFDGFGTFAAAASGNTAVSANRYMTDFFSPDGLAYAPPPSDDLFIGEVPDTHNPNTADIVVVTGASTFNGSVTHSQVVTGVANPGGMAYDNIRNILFAYDAPDILVFTDALKIAGSLGSLESNGTAHAVADGTAAGNTGFGLALDTTH